MENCEEQYRPSENDDHPFPKAAVPAEEDLAAWIAGQDDTFAVMLTPANSPETCKIPKETQPDETNKYYPETIR